MKREPPVASRKSDHIRINIEEDVQSGLTNGLEHYSFVHQALPDVNLDMIDTTLNLFGRNLASPLLISSMTGGTAEAESINLTLAEAAQRTGIAMGLGSQRAAIDSPEWEKTFRVRQKAPDILLFANLGAIQLNYGYGVEHCQRAVDMVQADALFLHLNPLQEALQSEGETHFSGLLMKIEQVCRGLSVPVVIKEVGWGISAETAVRLASAGVQAVDVAGAGGTSWSQVEMFRTHNEHDRRIAGLFRDWGIPTAEAIRQVKQAAPDLLVFASGGLKNGLDIAKCIALGAAVGGMAGPFLKAAAISLDETVQSIDEVKKTIQISMFAAGVPSLHALAQTKLNHRGF
ncbi:MAG TPA: type 2 isopentenyl-diphosphate Delta-isomerase [Longilinea sp.]|nr:type 2 isopentenyl-diphosphate Delta-isomerase [Longilinea sp.]